MQLSIEDLIFGTMFLTFADSLVTLVICVLIGVIGRISGILNDDSDKILSNVLINIALPATVLSSMLRPFSEELLMESVITFAIMSIVFLCGWGLGTLMSYIMSANAKEKRIWQLALMFPNVIFMGFPMVQIVFGDEGVPYAAMTTLAFSLIAFSLGVYIINADEKTANSRKLKIRNIFLTPAIVAMVVGFTFFLTSLRLPVPVERGVGLIGNMTSPLAMLLIGSLLMKAVKENGVLALVSDWRVYPIVFMRLVIIPLVVFFAISPFTQNTTMLGVIVTLVAMPVATITIIFAKQYNGDTTMALKTVVLSDILCLLTIPLISILL